MALQEAKEIITEIQSSGMPLKTQEKLINLVESSLPYMAKDVSGDGIERYTCKCGNMFHGKKNYCDCCGTKLNYKY